MTEGDKILCSVLAARNLGDDAYNNFLDHTFLADRNTTIRKYLATTGLGIMEEEPPESLKTRYGGWEKKIFRHQAARRIGFLLFWKNEYLDMTIFIR